MNLLKKRKQRQIIKQVNKLLRSYEDQVLRTRVAVRMADNGKLKYPQQLVTVGKTNADYTTIQAAIDSISDAASDKIYTVLIAPGRYDEAVTLKDYVNLIGIDLHNTTVLQGIKDNEVQVRSVCYLNIEVSSGIGLHLGGNGSNVQFYGDITSTANDANGVQDNVTSTLRLQGNITVSGTSSCAVYCYGTVNIYNSKLIASGGWPTVMTIEYPVLIEDSKIVNNHDDTLGHGIYLQEQCTLIVKNTTIVCTHADVNSIYAGFAYNVKIYSMYVNRAKHGNITNLITGGLEVVDADVE